MPDGDRRRQDENLPHVMRAQVKRLWKERVLDKAKQVDPDHEYEWLTLAYGFFLGRGYGPDEAMELALQVDR